MRPREEIEKSERTLRVENFQTAIASETHLILEVLLDIRELLDKDLTPPQ